MILIYVASSLHHSPVTSSQRPFPNNAPSDTLRRVVMEIGPSRTTPGCLWPFSTSFNSGLLTRTTGQSTILNPGLGRMAASATLWQYCTWLLPLTCAKLGHVQIQADLRRNLHNQ